jgi:hypothetical protein
MSANVINQMPYLRTTRNFPEELKQLTVEINKSYVDIANVVNARIIGIFPTLRPAITGESWFLVANQRQQTLRQVYTFTSTSSINHGISVNDTNQFTSCYGSYTDGTNSYGIIWGSSVAIAGQITFYITATQIVFLVGAGAPALTRGRIILEWLSQV